MKTQLSLSDAIRIGAAMRPQAFEALFSEIPATDGSKEFVIGSCALGSALEAVTGFHSLEEIEERYGFQSGTFLGSEAFPEIDELFTGSIPCQCKSFRIAAATLVFPQLGHVITHLNDDHHWTRERIADWLDTLSQTQDREATDDHTEQLTTA